MSRLMPVLLGRRSMRLLAGCIFFTAVGVLLLSMLGRYWPALDILAHFSGHLFGIALVSALAMFLPRFGFGILVLGFLAVPLVHAGMSNLVYSRDVTAATAQTPRIKLVSLNIWGGHSDLERIGGFLNDQKADILVLVEFSLEMRGLLEKLKAIYPHSYTCKKGCRIAILSKKRARQSGTQQRSSVGPRLVWATYDYDATPLTVVGTHLIKPIDSPVKQAREFDLLAKWLRRVPGDIVLAGDLNSTPWSYNFRKFMTEAGLHRASGIYPTWPASSMLPPQLAIDHVLVSDGVTINQLHIGERVSSDHLPVVTELSLTGRQSVRVSGATK